MKRKILNVKSIVLMLVFLFSSCDSDDCNNDSDIANSFPAKFRILSSNGENQLTNSEFDNSLLKFVDADFPNRTTTFDIIDFNGEQIIEFGFAVTTPNIIFEYNGENKLQLKLLDRQIVTENCATETLSFRAISESGALICDCKINELVTIEFDI